MEYHFYEQSDEDLIANSKLPLENGISVALFTTGYDASKDEIVEIAIQDFAGNLLFSQRVKPQNVEDWEASEASGGIDPQEVTDSPELFQFEDNLVELFKDASIVVTPHSDFMKAMLEASWISLPSFVSFDLTKRFCNSHSSNDYPNESAATASLASIADYYDVSLDSDALPDRVRAITDCYVKYVKENNEVRESKGEAYWRAYSERRAEAQKKDIRTQITERSKQIRTAQINALLWLCAAAVFANLGAVLASRGADAGFVVIAVAFAVFFVYKWVRTLLNLKKLSQENKQAKAKLITEKESGEITEDHS